MHYQIRFENVMYNSSAGQQGGYCYSIRFDPAYVVSLRHFRTSICRYLRCFTSVILQNIHLVTTWLITGLSVMEVPLGNPNLDPAAHSALPAQDVCRRCVQLN